MCGIAGFVDGRGIADPTVIERQLRLLEHRGPDSSGFHRTPTAVIGQTRLAVIDLVTGDPPITNEEGNIAVSLNGEIYNFQSLREELVKAGHSFSSKGDTEVIGHLAEDFEPTALAERLDGMFAAAIWDEKRCRLLLLRDRFGKKPLYYWTDNDRFVFASEIKALTAHPQVPRRLNANVIPKYLAFGYPPTPETFFEDIHSVPPGHVLVFEPSRGIELAEYWRPPLTMFGSGTHEEAGFSELARETRRLLGAAVHRRLISDVPLGAFLSGGIDSSSIVGLMAEASTQPVRTFTIGFDDQEGFDERAFAQHIATRFRTDHTEFVVHPHAVDLVEKLVWHHDQPFGDSSAIPTYLLSELTRGHVTVALSGDGGDELFGGYERFAAALLLMRYKASPRWVRTALRGLVGGLGSSRVRRLQSVQRFLARADDDVVDAFAGWISYVPGATRQDLLGVETGSELDEYRLTWSETQGAHLVDRLLHLNARTYLLDDLLPKVDRMSMAHGLEVRSPFLDKDLAEFAFRLPPHARIRAWQLKRVLKAAVKDLLPKEILRRSKKGFGIPLDRWFREDLAGYIDSGLLSASARTHGFLKADAIERIVREHRAGASNHGHTLWTLLTLEVFLRKEGW